MPSLDPATARGLDVSSDPNANATVSVDALIRTTLERTGRDGRIVAVLVAEVLIREAIRGNVRALRELLDRTEGKVVESATVDREEESIQILKVVYENIGRANPGGEESADRCSPDKLWASSRAG
jgi:hypothetical protein